MEMKSGSMVQRPLRGVGGTVFKHVGIYVGNNQVVHYIANEKKDKSAVIVKTSLRKFADGKRVSVRAEPKNRAHQIAVKKEALKVLGATKNEFNKQYDFLLKNCEDFSRHCYQVRY